MENNHQILYRVKNGTILRLHHYLMYEGEAKSTDPYSLNMYAYPESMKPQDNLLRNKLNPERLKIYTKDGKEITVKQLYESHIIYSDGKEQKKLDHLIDVPSKNINKEIERIQKERKWKGLNSLYPIGYEMHEQKYELDGSNYFYSYIYANMLKRNSETTHEMMNKKDLAFTDAWFNDTPDAYSRIQDPAQSIAQYIALKEKGELETALKDPNTFKEALSKIKIIDMNYEEYMDKEKEAMLKKSRENQKAKPAPQKGRQVQKEPVKKEGKEKEKDKGMSM